MRLLSIIALVVFSLTQSTFAAYKYCGHLNSVRIETGGGWSIIRLSLFNSNNDPKSIVLKDVSAIEDIVAKMIDNPDYQRGDHNFDWYWKDFNKEERYFMCVEGSNLDNFRGKFFMDSVDSFRIWKNREEL